MEIPYPQYTQETAPISINETIANGEVLTITLVGSDPNGGTLTMIISGCPSALQPTLIVNEINYSEIPVGLLNSYYEWLSQQPNSKFYKYEYTVTGASAVVESHTISFQVTDNHGKENWVKAIICTGEETSYPFLDGFAA